MLLIILGHFLVGWYGGFQNLKISRCCAIILPWIKYNIINKYGRKGIIR
jgi:hypothetical protein